MQVGEIADLLQQLALRRFGVPKALELLLINVSRDAVPRHLAQGVGVEAEGAALLKTQLAAAGYRRSLVEALLRGQIWIWITQRHDLH